MQKRATKEAAAAGVVPVTLMTHGTTEASIREALARTVEDGRGAREAPGYPHRTRSGLRWRPRRLRERASAEDEDRRMRILAIALMCATMVCFTGQDTCAKWLSASLPIAQIVWARYVGASVIALIASRSLSRPADATFEASTTAAVALRLALLFDDRERVCRPRAPAVGDCDNLVSHAGLRGSSCRTCAGRKSERGTDDRNRARISRRGDRDAPGNGGVSADRSSRCRGRCLQFAYTCWPPASSLARIRRRRRSRGRKSPASCF